MTNRPRKALIIGAGIAGPVAAILLKRAGIEAQVFEAWPHSTGIGGGIQIAPNGMHVLAEIGLADELIRRGSICESIDFYSQSGAPLGSVNRDMVQRFGQPAVNMRRATLNEAIINKAWCANVELYFEKRLARIEDRADQPVVAHFADGTSAEGDFLIGADGVHSAVRAHVIPDGPIPFDTGLIGFGGFVPRSVLEAPAPAPASRRPSDRAASSATAFAAPIRARRDVVEHPARARHRRRDLPRHEPGRAEAAPAQFPRRLARSDPADDGSAGDIVVTATLDVATLPTWSRGRRS